MARSSPIGFVAVVIIAVVSLFWFGFMAGTLVVSERLDAKEASLFSKLMNCGYTRHGISDMAWIYYIKGVIPAGSARYFTVRLSSNNIGAVGACIKEKIG